MRKLAATLGVLALAWWASATAAVPAPAGSSLALLGVFSDWSLVAPAPPPAPAVFGPHPQARAAKRVRPAAPPPPAPPAWLRAGRLIDLERMSPQTVELGGRMRFVATLVNRTEAGLNLIAEVIVRKGDGSQETLIGGHRLKLGQGKAFRVPVGMAAKAQRFPPGLTEFIAFLRDPRGQLIDEASISFLVTVPLY